MPRTIRCRIVTPARSVLDEEVTYASIPCWDGKHGVMTGQSPLLSRLGIGGLRIDLPAGEKRVYWVEGGFARVEGNELTILTKRAARPEELSAEEAEAELAEANAAAVGGGRTSEAERRRAEEAQQSARSRRQIARAVRRG